jgi:surfeit locus 1 family protein
VSIARPLRFWAITGATIVGLLLTLSLGAWQLGRAQAKLALEANITARQSMAPLDATALFNQDAKELVHRPVVLRGTWDTRHTIYLDNRQMQGRQGFYVVTPLKLEGSDRAVVIERGWVQRDFLQRDRLPSVSTPTGTVEIRGRIAPPPARLYEFAKTVNGPIRQNLDLADFREETGLALLDIAVMQTGEPSEGLLRDWPRAATGVEKHYGYAFQWWALSALIAILYVWFQFIAPRKAAHAR